MIAATIRLIWRTVLWIDLLICTLVVYCLAWLPKFLRGQWFLKIFQGWCWVFIRALGVNLKLHQKNQHPLPKQYILIGNHPSAFEDIGMPALFPVRFLAKYEVQFWWLVGRISRAANTLYVKREEAESRKAAQADLIAALNQGDSIGLYPEGGCKGKRIHLPFRYGIFDVALQTGVPILPVFLHYEAQEDFEWGPQTLIQKIIEMSRAINKDVNYYVFDAIDPKQFDSKELLTIHVQNCYLEWQKKYLE